MPSAVRSCIAKGTCESLFLRTTRQYQAVIPRTTAWAVVAVTCSWELTARAGRRAVAPWSRRTAIPGATTSRKNLVRVLEPGRLVRAQDSLPTRTIAAGTKLQLPQVSWERALGAAPANSKVRCQARRVTGPPAYNASLQARRALQNSPKPGKCSTHAVVCPRVVLWRIFHEDAPEFHQYLIPTCLCGIEGSTLCSAALLGRWRAISDHFAHALLPIVDPIGPDGRG